MRRKLHWDRFLLVVVMLTLLSHWTLVQTIIHSLLQTLLQTVDHHHTYTPHERLVLIAWGLLSLVAITKLHLQARRRDD